MESPEHVLLRGPSIDQVDHTSDSTIIEEFVEFVEVIEVIEVVEIVY